MPTPKIDSARSFLFVPADRPQRFGKALEAGADVVVVDLEDAVPPEAKGMARQALAAWLDPARPVVIRINGVGTAWHEADRELARHPGVAAVMLPKAGDAADLATFDVPVIPLVESARGMGALADLAGAPGVLRLAFGTIDFMLDLGIPSDGSALDVFRAQMALASRLADIAPPIDGVTVGFDDLAAVERDTRRALAFGFGARLLIHPRQVEPVHRAMRPTEEELTWARDLLALVAAQPDGAVSFRGAMVDRPVIERARRLLARA